MTQFRVALDLDTWSTPAWPLAFPAAGVLLALAVLLISALARSGLGRPVTAINLVAGGILASIAATALPVMLGFGSDRARTFGALFGELLRWEAWLQAGALGVLTLAAAVWAARPREGGTPWVRLGLGAGVLVCIGIGAVHGVWVRALGQAPEVTIAVPPRVHVGHTLELQPEVSLPGWDAEKVVLRAERPGPVEGELRVSRFGVEMTRPVTTLAGQDRSDPADGLAVGNTWRFAQRVTREDQLLWVIPSHGSYDGPGSRVWIAGDRELDGRHVYDAVMNEEGEAAGPPVRFVLYAWDGAVYVDGEERRWIERTGAVDSDGTVACTVAYFPGDCRCYVRPMGEGIEVPGPASCAWSGGSTGSAIVTAFLAIVTAGLVITDPDPTYQVQLVSSGRELPAGRSGP